MRCRERFEAWVSAPPYEQDTARLGRDSSWPGQYASYAVQLAWLAWQEAAKVKR